MNEFSKGYIETALFLSATESYCIHSITSLGSQASQLNIQQITIYSYGLCRKHCFLDVSNLDFYGDLVYKLKKIAGSNNVSAQFIKIISHYKKIGYNINVLQQTACLVFNPITVGNFAFLFNCTPVGRTSDSMMVPT